MIGVCEVCGLEGELPEAVWHNRALRAAAHRVAAEEQRSRMRGHNLRPLTSAAKELHRRAGSWVLRQTRDRVLFTSETGPWLLFESVQPINRFGTEVVWVRRQGDKDFEVRDE